MFIIANNKNQFIVAFDSDVCYTEDINVATVFPNVFKATEYINKWNLQDWKILRKELIQKENK